MTPRLFALLSLAMAIFGSNGCNGPNGCSGEGDGKGDTTKKHAEATAEAR